MTFEESINKLNEIVRSLENADMDLDKSLEAFEEGTKIIKECYDMLDKAELKVSILNGEKEEPFNE